MSLWKVNDETTQELMINFYSAWMKGNTKRESLRMAQNSIREKYKHPYYWGPFIIIGE